MEREEFPSLWNRAFWIAGGILVFYVLAGFFLLPLIVKTQIEQRLSAQSGRVVTVGKVRINPLALSVTVEGFDVRTADGRAAFVGWERLYVNFEALASLRREWVLGEVALEGFMATSR